MQLLTALYAFVPAWPAELATFVVSLATPSTSVTPALRHVSWPIYAQRLQAHNMLTQIYTMTGTEGKSTVAWA